MGRPEKCIDCGTRMQLIPQPGYLNLNPRLRPRLYRCSYCNMNCKVTFWKGKGEKWTWFEGERMPLMWRLLHGFEKPGK